MEVGSGEEAGNVLDYVVVVDGWMRSTECSCKEEVKSSYCGACGSNMRMIVRAGDGVWRP